MHHVHDVSNKTGHGAKRHGGGGGGGGGGSGGGGGGGGGRASDAASKGGALTLEEKVKRLDGGLEMLRAGKTAEEVIQAYSRHALVKALAEMRAKTLQEPRKCGVREGASWCVGEWCARADATAGAAAGSKAWRLEE
jgi:hypothetical protein